jgi:CheY-like chemotaxis protein
VAHILVIEDEENILGLITTMLEKSGHHVVGAHDGTEGLMIYRDQPTDLVITDILMPKKDGVETIRELKRDFPQARIIAITGYRGRFNRLPAAEFVGAQVTLMKPFTQSQLLEAVDGLLK